ncbi:MAG TPA: hypothetical protein VK084_02690 [Chitinophagaceae bacterium]|nr:hypothetical protein [Chitinophagaceae bacterium]
MKDKDVLDLRFVIGIFFGIVGILLILTDLTAGANAKATEFVNLWAGIGYILFCAFMIIIWWIGSNKEAKEKEVASDSTSAV